MNRKLIFFDVDGTLVGFRNGKSEISDSTIEAIAKLHENGHLTALATGRSRIMSKKVMEDTGIQNAVLHTGAQILVDGDSVYEKKIGPRLVKAILEDLRDSAASIIAFDGTEVFGRNFTSDIESYMVSVLGERAVRPLDQLSGSVFSMNAYVDRERVKAILEKHPSSLGHSNDYTEITPFGISKGSGIRRMAELFGIPMEDTIAFGDGGNDFDLFEAAGLSIAMGNANDRLKSVANHVTDDIFSDGIRNILTILNLI